MSATADEDSSPLAPLSEALDPLKARLLIAYKWFRRRPWLAIVLIGFVWLGLALFLDPARGGFVVEHGVFSGMFGLFGITTILVGIMLFVFMKVVYLYGRYVEEG